jgi:hypothetical protein
MLKTVPSPVESPFCRTSLARRFGDLSLGLLDLGSWESPPSISLRATRKPEFTGLVIDERVRDWLWLRKVLAPLAHPT